MKYFVCAPADSKNGTNGEEPSRCLASVLSNQPAYREISKEHKNVVLVHFNLRTYKGGGGGGARLPSSVPVRLFLRHILVKFDENQLLS